MSFPLYMPKILAPGTLVPSGDTTGLTDAANLANAIAASSAAAAPGNLPVIQLAAGQWYLGTGQIPLTGPVKIQGSGEGLVVGGSLVAGTVINCANNTGVFTFPWQGYLWSGLEVSDICFNYSGAGNLFHAMNLADSKFTNLQINLTNNAGRAFYSTGNVSVINVTWDRCLITTTTAARTVEMVHLSSSASGSVSNNTFWRCKFNNAGLDANQYMAYIDCTAGSSGYHYTEVFRDCWFEHPFGGAVKSLSGMGLSIESCMIWDIFTGQGATVSASTFYIGAYATGPGSQQTAIRFCGRNRNGPNGTTTWDVYCEATTSGTLIEGFTVKPDSASTLTNAFFNFNSHPDVALIGNMSPQGAAVNGNSTCVITNPSPTQASISLGTILPLLAGWAPADSGYLEWNFDPGALEANGNLLSAAAAAGTPYLIRVNVRVQRLVTNVLIHMSAAGSGLTAGENFAGLISSAGTLIGSSADQTSAWGGAAGVLTIPLVGGPYVVNPGFVWVPLLWNGTTSPTFGRAQNFSATPSNAGVPVTAARWAASSSTGQITLPASITPSGNVLGQLSFWAALS